MDKHFPEGYKPALGFFQTEKGIKLVKDAFERKLSKRLNLSRVSARKYLELGNGLQDDLALTQQPVGFELSDPQVKVEIVHSLAKWKRHVLGKYGFGIRQGLYTDMDAIRKDEKLSPIHSNYVDQWDWEKVIRSEDRSLGYLETIVKRIYGAIKETEKAVEGRFRSLKPRLPAEISFVHSEDLEREYPSLTPRERETEAARKYRAFFLIGIGNPLSDGKPHDLRAADYDDWSTETKPGYHGLNGDIIVWDDVRKDSLELSSMGIRVDKGSLKHQLESTGLANRLEFEFHKGIMEDRLPLSIGGGIGQSRLCMFLLRKAHIGEVQSTYWPDDVRAEAEEKGVVLL